eukprot:1178804-Prorocentrum_minimum.AAC.2
MSGPSQRSIGTPPGALVNGARPSDDEGWTRRTRRSSASSPYPPPPSATARPAPSLTAPTPAWTSRRPKTSSAGTQRSGAARTPGLWRCWTIGSRASPSRGGERLLEAPPARRGVKRRRWPLRWAEGPRMGRVRG